jgi:hypothetical protein
LRRAAANRAHAPASQPLTLKSPPPRTFSRTRRMPASQRS